MVNYSNSIIYKLCCKDPNITEIYIGSTVNKYRRKQQHKNDCNNENVKIYNCYVYQFIRGNGNFENWDFVEIEQYNAADKGHLHARERYWIEELKSELNKVIPTRTQKEYREANKDVFSEYKKEYYEANKDVISERVKEYKEANKDKIKEYREANKDKIKEYNQANKDKKKEYMREWRKKRASSVLINSVELIDFPISTV